MSCCSFVQQAVWFNENSGCSHPRGENRYMRWDPEPSRKGPITCGGELRAVGGCCGAVAETENHGTWRSGAQSSRRPSTRMTPKATNTYVFIPRAGNYRADPGHLRKPPTDKGPGRHHLLLHLTASWAAVVTSPGNLTIRIGPTF